MPKPMLTGFGVSCATGAGLPVPVRAMLIGELEALLINETLPLSDPIAGGAKFNVKEALAPAARVKGRFSPEVL